MGGGGNKKEKQSVAKKRENLTKGRRRGRGEEETGKEAHGDE